VIRRTRSTLSSGQASLVRVRPSGSKFSILSPSPSPSPNPSSRSRVADVVAKMRAANTTDRIATPLAATNCCTSHHIVLVPLHCSLILVLYSRYYSIDPLEVVEDGKKHMRSRRRMPRSAAVGRIRNSLSPLPLSHVLVSSATNMVGACLSAVPPVICIALLDVSAAVRGSFGSLSRWIHRRVPG
jgi:hypothetical protein